MDKSLKRKRIDSTSSLTTSTPDEVKYELSDEIWLEIIHFCYSDRLGSCAFDDLFRYLPYVSKYFRDICIRYAQCVPLNLNIFTCNCESDFARIAWACRHRVKIGGFRVKHHDCNALWLLAIQQMLQNCNLSDLTTIDLSLLEDVSPYHIKMHHLSGIKKLRIPGFSNKVMKRAARKKIGHVDYIHSTLANVFAKQDDTFASISLKKLSIVIEKKLWPHPMLEVFSQTLEELTLHLTCNILQHQLSSQDRQNDPDMEGLTRTIESMPNLKKFTLHAQFSTCFKIRSKSLEILDVSNIDPLVGFQITECICPNLKMRI